MAIRGFEKKDPYSGLNQLMQLMNQIDAMGARKEQGIANKMTALSKQIENANNLDSLTNISGAVNSFNKEVEMMGYDEYSLASLVNAKKEIFENANNAFNNARKYIDMDEGDPDELYNSIMAMDWSEANKELNDLYSMMDSINQGVKSGFSHISDGKYTRTALGKAVEKRIGQIQNKLDVFAENEGEWLVYNPEDGSMDEAAASIYKDLQFKILSGDTKDFDKYFDDVIDDVSRKFQIQEKGYNDWLKIAEESKQFKTLSEMDLLEEDKEIYRNAMYGNNEDGDGQVSLNFAKQMAENYRTNAYKYNRQHEVLTGKKYNNNPTYSNIDLEDMTNIPGTTLDDNASKIDSNNNEKELLDSQEVVKKEKVVKKQEIKPTTEIIWDKSANKVSIGAPQETETAIQKKLFSGKEKKQSLIKIEFRNKNGDIVDISKYDKDSDSYVDVIGRKYSKDELSINADSLKDYQPKLKKAAGDYYFFDPTKNQFAKWGSSSIFGNQTMETFNGKKVPTIILKSEFQGGGIEGISIGGKSTKGDATEKLIYWKGNWRRLKKENNQWKFKNK